MKKKLILTLIPLCLLMGACASNNYKIINNPVQTEEADTDDDEFLNAEIKCLDPVIADSNNPTIGVQRIQNTGSVSVRFVGLIKLTDKNSDGKIDDDDLPSSTVRWTRTSYLANGNTRRSATNINATQIYEAINADGNRYTIAQYNSAHNTSYTHFVTYAIRNIPSAQYKGNILMKLNVNNVNSKIVCSSGDGYTLFTFDESQTGYFLVKKTTTGAFETILPTAYHTDGSPYEVRFEGLNRTASNDTKTAYILVNKSSSTFKTYGFAEFSAYNNGVNTSSEYRRPYNNANFFVPTSYLTNGMGGDATYVAIASGNEKIPIIKKAPLRRICFRVNADPNKFASYVASYRLMLELHVREKIRENYSYTIHYEEVNMEIINCRITTTNTTYPVLCAVVNISYNGTNDDSVSDNIKWWSIRDQYTGYSGFPSDTFYGAGNIANATTASNNRLCYVCTPKAATETPMGNNAAVNWFNGIQQG